jgi:predicted nucleic acid-binding protein
MSAATTRVLVDTSAWIDALREDGDERVRDTVKELTSDGLVVLCDVVRLELWNGAGGAAESRMLRDLERELECVPTTEQVWRTSIELARACRAHGLTIPAVDLLVAACADCHGLRLVHRDAHFDEIARIKGAGAENRR